jgi:hypothetical protein
MAPAVQLTRVRWCRCRRLHAELDLIACTCLGGLRLAETAEAPRSALDGCIRARPLAGRQRKARESALGMQCAWFFLWSRNTARAGALRARSRYRPIALLHGDAQRSRDPRSLLTQSFTGTVSRPPSRATQTERVRGLAAAQDRRREVAAPQRQMRRLKSQKPPSAADMARISSVRPRSAKSPTWRSRTSSVPAARARSIRSRTAGPFMHGAMS